GRRPRPAVDDLVRTLRAADREGLDPADYEPQHLEAARQSFDREHAVDFDVRCTYAYLHYAWDLTHGSIDPEKVAPQWHAAPHAGRSGRAMLHVQHAGASSRRPRERPERSLDARRPRQERQPHTGHRR